ncbi:MAG: hypothetical protein MRECE_41c003 [Mycoplasmataceae bacterium CE_OT135]|nr:MAG: hypothetical protein MRECE_41c003 [Mycoplasmataceae bacterium CE_OT135]
MASWKQFCPNLFTNYVSKLIVESAKTEKNRQFSLVLSIR